MDSEEIWIALPVDTLIWVDGAPGIRLTQDETRAIIASSARFQEANRLLARAVARSTPIRRLVEIDAGEEIVVRMRRTP